jgi:DNA ligase-1
MLAASPKPSEDKEQAFRALFEKHGMMFATEKIDGVRAIVQNGVLLSRSFKPIPNLHAQKLAKLLPEGADGELMIAGGTIQQTVSAVMSRDGEPDLTFYWFDIATEGSYLQRMAAIAIASSTLPKSEFHVVPLIPKALASYDEMGAMLAEVESRGGEGLIIRVGHGPYKEGRSTMKEGYAVKVKTFTTSEGTVVDFEELTHNTNEKQESEIGLTKRSTCKDGMVPGGTLGSLVVRITPEDVEGLKGDHLLRIGGAFTREQRQQIWDNREKYKGKRCTFKWFEVGTLNVPRFPIFVAWRHADDC